MKRIFKIVKRIEATSIRNALKKEKEAEIVEVFHDKGETVANTNEVGFKK